MARRASAITAFRRFLPEHFQSSRAQFDEIRSVVKSNFPKLCDDAKLCTHESPYRPEWEHQLRYALDYLKNKQKLISQDRHGEYIFP